MSAGDNIDVEGEKGAWDISTEASLFLVLMWPF
jgi:reverse gyrase